MIKTEINVPDIDFSDEGLRYQLSPGKVITLVEQTVKGDGNCGFTALGISRRELVKTLLPLVGSEEIRVELAPEIENLLRQPLTQIPESLQVERLLDIKQMLQQRQQECDQLIRRIKDEYEKTIGERPVMDVEHFIVWLRGEKDLSNVRKLVAACSAVCTEEDSLRDHCCRLETYTNYVAEFANIQWLGYRSALIYAKQHSISLYILRRQDGNTTLTCGKGNFYEAVESAKRVFILHTDGFTHFNVLAEVNVVKKPRNRKHNTLKQRTRKTALEMLDLDNIAESELDKEIEILSAALEEIEKLENSTVKFELIIDPTFKRHLLEDIAVYRKHIKFKAHCKNLVNIINKKIRYGLAINTSHDLVCVLTAYCQDKLRRGFNLFGVKKWHIDLGYTKLGKIITRRIEQEQTMAAHREASAYAYLVEQSSKARLIPHLKSRAREFEAQCEELELALDYSKNAAWEAKMKCVGAMRKSKNSHQDVEGLRVYLSGVVRTSKKNKRDALRYKRKAEAFKKKITTIKKEVSDQVDKRFNQLLEERIWGEGKKPENEDDFLESSPITIAGRMRGHSPGFY